MLRPSFRSFRVKLPSGVGYWTVLDSALRFVEVRDQFLRHLRFGRDGADPPSRCTPVQRLVPAMV